MEKLLSALVAVLSFAGMISGFTETGVSAQSRPGGIEHNGRANPRDSQPIILLPGTVHENVEVNGRTGASAAAASATA